MKSFKEFLDEGNLPFWGTKKGAEFHKKNTPGEPSNDNPSRENLVRARRRTIADLAKAKTDDEKAFYARKLKAINEGWKQVAAYGAGAAGINAGVAALIGLPPVVGAAIGLGYYGLSGELKKDWKAKDWKDYPEYKKQKKKEISRKMIAGMSRKPAFAEQYGDDQPYFSRGLKVTRAPFDKSKIPVNVRMKTPIRKPTQSNDYGKFSPSPKLVKPSQLGTVDAKSTLKDIGPQSSAYTHKRFGAQHHLKAREPHIPLGVGLKKIATGITNSLKRGSFLRDVLSTKSTSTSTSTSPVRGSNRFGFADNSASKQAFSKPPSSSIPPLPEPNVKGGVRAAIASDPPVMGPWPKVDDWKPVAGANQRDQHTAWTGARVLSKTSGSPISRPSSTSLATSTSSKSDSGLPTRNPQREGGIPLPSRKPTIATRSSTTSSTRSSTSSLDNKPDVNIPLPAPNRARPHPSLDTKKAPYVNTNIKNMNIDAIMKAFGPQNGK